jgi:hypothetical protein
MAENNDPPRQSQPFFDILKILNGLKQEPLSQRQRAELGRLHAHLQQDLPSLNRLRDMLAMSPEEAERWKQRGKGRPSGLFEKIQKAYERLQQEACEPEPATESAVAVNKPAEQAAPIKRKHPKQWSADWRKANLQGKDEGPGEYAQRMHEEMVKAPDVTEPWDFETCRRELYREPKEIDFEPTPDSVQTFPRHH